MNLAGSALPISGRTIPQPVRGDEPVAIQHCLAAYLMG
jgi:hypothetical protein